MTMRNLKQSVKLLNMQREIVVGNLYTNSDKSYNEHIRILLSSGHVGYVRLYEAEIVDLYSSDRPEGSTIAL